MCRRRGRGLRARPPRAPRHGRRAGRAPLWGPAGRTRRRCEPGRAAPLRCRSGGRRGFLLFHRRRIERLRNGLRLGRRLLGHGLDGLVLRLLSLVGGADLHDAAGHVLAGRLPRCQLLVRRNAAEARAGQCRVRAALAVRQDRRAAAGELLAVLAAEGRVGLLLRELGVGLDVDLPAGQAGGEAGIQALLADRERELVVRDDHRRVARLVVDVDLTHARGRERLRDEAGRLGVPRDDVDLLAAKLGHDHADARAARADTGADRVDALGVRLDRDLGAVAGLTGDRLDLDETVGDLRHLELEQRPDQLRVAAREDDLRALRPRANLGDHGLDAASLLVALAVDLLGARQQRLDLAEVDEHVVAVACLLDDAGHDLALPVLVLLVHHLALGLADPLQDHLLRGLRGDAAEVLRRHVLALDLLLGHVRPVEVKVVVRDEHVRLLARLDLERLELLVRALAGLFEQLFLEVLRKLDREDAEVAGLVVELDGGVPGGARRLLVGGEERVLERLDQRVFLDALLALDRADGFDDLSAHRQFTSSIRFPRTIAAYGMETGSVPWAPSFRKSSFAARTSPRKRLRPSISADVRRATLRPTAFRKCAGLRRGRSRPGELTSTVYRTR